MDQRWVRCRARFAQVSTHAPDVGFWSIASVWPLADDFGSSPRERTSSGRTACPKVRLPNHAPQQMELLFYHRIDGEATSLGASLEAIRAEQGNRTAREDLNSFG